MKKPTSILTLLLILAASNAAIAEENAAKDPANLSLKNEIDLGIARGLDYLKGVQTEGGSWAPADLPAVTSLVVTAFLKNPDHSFRNVRPPFLQKGIDFILSQQQADGGIYVTKYLNYNTSISIMALIATEDPKMSEPLAKARAFVIEGQYIVGPESADAQLNGGVGYGHADKHPDLSNTVTALEALRATESIETAEGKPEGKPLDWNAAIAFVQRCQNSASNKAAWSSHDAQDLGGFVYQPGATRGEQVTLPDGSKTFRSYGTMTYAGLLSYIYCDLKPGDPRVKSALDWIQANYTLDRNPGIGSEEGLEGLYYYYNLMAKALSKAGATELKLKDGKTADWRKELSERLLKIQKPDGSWVNVNGRWMENNPVLVTAYAILALEAISETL